MPEADGHNDDSASQGRPLPEPSQPRTIQGSTVFFWIALVAMLLAVADPRSVNNLEGSVSAWQLSQAAAARDFYQVWWPIKAESARDVADLYAPEARQAMGRVAIAEAQAPDAGGHLQGVARFSAEAYPNYFATTFTPVMVSSYAVFAFDDYDTARRAFALVSLAAFVGGLLLLCRLAGLTWAMAFATVAVIAWTCQPLRNDIVDGNVNRLQIGVVAIYLWLTVTRRHLAWQVLAGVIVGWLVLFKPNLALLPIFASAALIAAGPRPRWLAQWAGMIGAGVMGIAIPALLFGTPTIWLSWLDRMKQVHATPYPVETGNIATARLIAEATGANASALLALVLIAAGVALCIWLGRRAGEVTPRLAMLAAGAAAAVAMIASQLAWPHYALLLLPLLLAGWGEAEHKLSAPRAAVIACYIVIAERHLRQWFDMSNTTYGWLLALAMLTAVGVAVWQIATAPATAPPHEPDASTEAA